MVGHRSGPCGKGLDIMNGSNHFVTGLTRTSPPVESRRRCCNPWMGTIGVAIAVCSGAAPAFAGMAGGAPPPSAPPAIEPVSPTPPEIPPVNLIGLSGRDILPDAGPDTDLGTDGSSDPAVAPPATSLSAPRPVTIPFPNAAHLFFPGAALALYAARRMFPRYRGARGH
jgi:hypothetical protein